MANPILSILGKGAGAFDVFGGLGIIIYVLLGALMIVVLVGGGIWYYKSKKQWNLNVEFKLPRGIEHLKEEEELDPLEIHGIINAEWGLGSFNAKRGAIFLKRKGMKKIFMKPFDIKKYLQGRNILTVVQIGVEKYLPVLQGSYLNMVDDETGEEAALLNTSMDTTEDKSWSTGFEREANNTYTIINLLKEYLQFFGWGIILAFNFVGFAILYTRLA